MKRYELVMYFKIRIKEQILIVHFHSDNNMIPMIYRINIIRKNLSCVKCVLIDFFVFEVLKIHTSFPN